jgi:diacylglycerol kinase (ATP)
MKLLFIINPTSGNKSNDDAILSIHRSMAESGLDFKFLYTSVDNVDERITGQIEDYKPDRIAACGGDGTVQQVARNLIGQKTPMGILPLGSANGLAKALNIPQDVEEALDLFITGKKSDPLDLLEVNNHICIHLSDIGTNAILVKNYEEAGDKGMIGYAKHLIPSIQESETMQYTIKTPEGSFDKEGYVLVIANANQYGTGVRISDGSMFDGKFEICNIQKMDLESTVKAGLTAINIFVDKNMFADVISCTSAHININRKVHLQIDGEYIGEVDTIEAKIIPAAIRVLIHK